MERRYPRAACNRVVELELRRRKPDGQVARVAIPATMRSLSREGLGFQVPGPWGLVPRRGDQVVSRFAVHGNLMEVPGQVVWTASGRLGVRVELAAVPAVVRDQFAAWAVEAMTEVDGDDPIPLTSAHHSSSSSRDCRSTSSAIETRLISAQTAR